MTIPSAPFWMVYGVGQNAPTRRHETYGAARAEAKRLAIRHPGIAFVVLEAVAAVVKDDVQTVVFKEERKLDEDLPF